MCAKPLRARPPLAAAALLRHQADAPSPSGRPTAARASQRRPPVTLRAPGAQASGAVKNSFTCNGMFLLTGARPAAPHPAGGARNLPELTQY